MLEGTRDGLVQQQPEKRHPLWLELCTARDVQPDPRLPVIGLLGRIYDRLKKDGQGVRLILIWEAVNAREGVEPSQAMPETSPFEIILNLLPRVPRRAFGRVNSFRCPVRFRDV